MSNHPKSIRSYLAEIRNETHWDKTDGISELRGRLERIRQEFECASEVPLFDVHLEDIIEQANKLDAAYLSLLSEAEEGFERRGGGFGGGHFHPPRDDRFSNLVSYIKHRSMSLASAAKKAESETEFAAIDEAIATHRAAMPFDPDHGPMGNPEAELAYEIKLLRAENERLKIKLSRMCGDA